jgi:hypothetical protein
MSSLILIFSVAFVFKVLGVAKQGIIKGIWESIEMVGRIIGWIIGILLLFICAVIGIFLIFGIVKGTLILITLSILIYYIYGHIKNRFTKLIQKGD